jgi:hypothetical protein
MPVSPTQRSLAKLRKEGYLCGIVEKVIPKCFIRKDLFGFIDILAIKENEILGVQSTSRVNFSTRVKKILENENYEIVKKSGIRIVVHGWGKIKSGMDCKEIDLTNV